MSRTYRKFVKCGICNGSNTEYYREKNRKCRAKNHHSLRNMIANYDIEVISDIIPLGEVPVHDSWNEPTDGTFLISKNSKNDYIEEPIWHRNETGIHYWNRKFGKYLKSKNKKYHNS